MFEDVDELGAMLIQIALEQGDEELTDEEADAGLDYLEAGFPLVAV